MNPCFVCRLQKVFRLLSLFQLLTEYGLAGDARGFMFNTQSASWNRARRTCQANGAQLASIRTQRDFHAIENLKTESPAFQVHEYWIGLHRSASGFVWADCSAPTNLNFDQWAFGHPGTGGCVHVLRTDTNWYTATCELNKNFICEKDTGDCTFGVHVDQTSYGDQSSALETASSVPLSGCKARCNNYSSPPSCEYIVYTSAGECHLHSTEPTGLTAGSGSDTVYRRNCYSRIHEYWNLVQPEIAGDSNTDPSTDSCQNVAQPGQETTTISDSTTTSFPTTTSTLATTTLASTTLSTTAMSSTKSSPTTTISSPTTTPLQTTSLPTTTVSSPTTTTSSPTTNTSQPTTSSPITTSTSMTTSSTTTPSATTTTPTSTTSSATTTTPSSTTSSATTTTPSSTTSSATTTTPSSTTSSATTTTPSSTTSSATTTTPSSTTSSATTTTPITSSTTASLSPDTGAVFSEITASQAPTTIGEAPTSSSPHTWVQTSSTQSTSEPPAASTSDAEFEQTSTTSGDVTGGTAVTNYSSTSLNSTSVTAKIDARNTSEMCPCDCLNPVLSPEEKELFIQGILSSLTINTRNTSAYVRTLTSATDPRVSAKAVGCTGLVLLTTAIGGIILLDLGTLIKDIKMLGGKIREIFCAR